MKDFNSEEHLTKIAKNYDTFVAFCNQVGPRREKIQAMLDHIGERLLTAPASSREAYHNCWPGGLVDHSLRVMRNTYKLLKVMGWEGKFSKESIIISALFHDLGKVGGVDEDHYVPADDWQKKRGQLYTYNPKLQFMLNSHRALFLLQHFGIELTEDEYLAILLNDGPEASENTPYNMKEPTLAVVIHQADRLSCEEEKLLARDETSP